MQVWGFEVSQGEVCHVLLCQSSSSDSQCFLFFSGWVVLCWAGTPGLVWFPTALYVCYVCYGSASMISFSIIQTYRQDKLNIYNIENNIVLKIDSAAGERDHVDDRRSDVRFGSAGVKFEWRPQMSSAMSQPRFKLMVAWFNVDRTNLTFLFSKCWEDINDFGHVQNWINEILANSVGFNKWAKWERLLYHILIDQSLILQDFVKSSIIMLTYRHIHRIYCTYFLTVLQFCFFFKIS